MSKIDVNDKLLEHLSNLSKLSIKKEDFPRFKSQIQKILDYMAILNKPNTDGVTPMFGGIEFPPTTRMDLTQEPLTKSQVLANAPSEKEGLFGIPKVIE